MKQPIDLAAWRKDGEQLWSRIQQSKLVVLPWNNPWRTLAKLSLVPLISSAVAAFILKNHHAAVFFGLISLVFILPALVLFVVDWRHGGLYSFFLRPALVSAAMPTASPSPIPPCNCRKK